MLFKTEHTKELLVRYIRDNNLAPGSRLPGQKELRRLFGVGGTTIIAALKALEADGVVDIRNRVGVYVTDSSADGHAGRCIGVVGKWPLSIPFQAIFIENLEYALRREGCRVVRFWRSGSSFDETRGFDEYPGLRRMMVSRELDGLIMVMQPLANEIHDLARKLRIPLAGLSVDEMDSNDIILDFPHMIRESVRLLKEQHFRMPGLVSVETERGAYQITPYREAMAEYYPEFKNIPIGHFLIHDMDPLKSDLCDRIRQWVIDVDALPAPERPDALIIMDDIFAQWVIEFMWRLNLRWRPEMMVLRNRQMPIGITAQRCGSWMVDASALAELMVGKMLWMTRTGHLRFPNIFAKPEYIAPSAPEA